MAKRTTSLDLALPPREAGAPAARWLYEALRQAILAGRLRPGARLPASRDLARRHQLARGTIVAAFEQLQAEGYLDARTGSGTFVARVLPDELLTLRGRPGVRHGAAGPSRSSPLRPSASGATAMPLGRAAPERAAPREPGGPGGPGGTEASAMEPGRRAADPRARRFSGYGQRAQLFSNLQGGPMRAFRANRPALDLFPVDLWAKVAARRLRRASAGMLLSCEPLGYRPLQEEVAGYLTTARGVCCAAEQVAIVSGVQEALDLTARLVLDRGDRAAVEDPGYTGATQVFAALGAEIVPLPVDAEGVTLPPDKLAGGGGVRLVYVTPAHQFPLGTGMSLARRLALLQWAEVTGALIFEDDYDSEYRYAGRPMPALQGLDGRGDQVLYAGSFSKVLFPALRLGYLVLPADLLERFAAAQSIARRHPPVLDQAIVADFMAAGHFARHVRRMREVYAERLAVLLDAARRHLGGLLEISPIEAGLQTAGWLCCGLDGETAAAAAARRNVEVEPLSRYAWRGQRATDGLQIGFAAIDPQEIRRGAADLAAALEQAAGVAPAPRHS